MKLCEQNTKVLECSRDVEDLVRIIIENYVLQEVKEYNYLGSKIISHEQSCKETIIRIDQAKMAIN